MYYLKLKEEYEKLANETFILEEYIYKYKCYLYDPDTPVSYQKRTIFETLLDLQKFDRFLLIAYPNLKKITEIESFHIEAYKRFCMESLDNSNITINKKINAIKKFFSYLRDIRKELKHNIALDISYLVKVEAEHPLHIPKSHLDILVNILYTYKYGVRDVCITKLLAFLGLQINEIFSLTVDYVSLSNKEVYIKRNRELFTFPIPDILYVDLKNYLMLRNELVSGYSNNILFLSNSGKPYPPREYQRKFKLAVIDADFKEPYTPRNARATFCYYMAKAVEKNDLKVILNQQKVDHYYINDILKNPLI